VGALYRFEQHLEHLVTGAFARVFRSEVQPMEIAAALQREVDNGAQILSRERRIVPNDFTIGLSASDYDRLSAYGQTLSSELASMLHEHAQEQRYVFAGPVQLSFQRLSDLSTGRFRVHSAAMAQVTPAPRQEVPNLEVNRVSLFLEIGGQRHPLRPPGMVIGRGSGADLRIDDAGVSRRHVEFRVQSEPVGSGSGTEPPATVTVVDLGSTNGTTVGGRRIQHAVLTDGSVVQIGSIRIVLRIVDERVAPHQPPAGSTHHSAAPPQAGPSSGEPPLTGPPRASPYVQPPNQQAQPGSGYPPYQQPQPGTGYPPYQPYSSRTQAPGPPEDR